MERYYKIDIRRMPMSIVRSWGIGSALVLALRKWLPIPFYAETLVSAELDVDPIAEAEADPTLLRMLAAGSAEMASMGWSPVLLYSVAVLGPSRGLGRVFLAPEGDAVCLLIAGVSGTLSQTSVQFLSAEQSGALLGASSTVLRLPSVPGLDVLRLPGASARELAAAHLARLKGRSVRRLGASDVRPLLMEQQQRSLSHYVSSGLYVEATPAEVATKSA